MARYIKVNTFNLARLNNAEYLTFMRSVIDLIPVKIDGDDGYPEVQSLRSARAMDASLIGVSEELLESMAENLDALGDAVQAPKTAVETAQATEHEANRDRLSSYVITRINSASKLPLKDEQEAGEILRPVIKPYIGIASLPSQQETAAISGMIRDLKSTKYATYTTRLGLDTYLSSLEEENNAYHQLIIQRLKEKEANKVESGTSIRERLDEEFEDLAMEAQSFNVVSPTTESTKFINELNRLISDTLALNKQRKNSGKNKDNQGSDKPSTDGGNEGSGDTGQGGSGNEGGNDDLPVVQ